MKTMERYAHHHPDYQSNAKAAVGGKRFQVISDNGGMFLSCSAFLCSDFRRNPGLTLQRIVLPRLGSWVQIPSPAPIFQKNQ